MFDLILCIVVFLIVFVYRLSHYFINKKKRGRKRDSIDILYLSNKFKLDKKKLNNFNVTILLALSNALIISLSLWISINITEIMILELLIGLVIVIVLIYIFNEIMGNILIKRGYEKNEL